MQVITPMAKQFEDNRSNTVDNLMQVWSCQLKLDFPDRSRVTRDSIMNWLLEADRERIEQLDAEQFQFVQQNMEYRYRILKNRYLGQTPQQAYRRLLLRLGSLVLMQNKTRNPVTLTSDRQRQAIKVLQEVLQDLLQCDRYVKQQIAAISKCTYDSSLRSLLLFASLEEYCLRPVCDRPSIVDRFIKHTDS